MSHILRNAGGNSFLASLPPADAALLQSISRIVHPSQGRVLVSHSEPSTEVWFPHTGVVALTITDVSGRSVQTGLVGSEGGVGLDALFDRSPTLPDAVVQIEGAMSVIQAAQLRSALIARPAIQMGLIGFLYSLTAQSLLTVACNRMHTLMERCCRWLLTIQDRAGRSDLPLTQENLAILLGSGRPRINHLLAALEKAGLVQRHRGRITLLERAELEKRACNCYRVNRNGYASFTLT